jgi:hypothetical protein
MKKIFYAFAALLALLPPALSAQDFNPARGPLEGVWENEEDYEEVIVFIGNLILERNWDSTYEVYPGMVYKNGEAFAMEPDLEETEHMFSYKLSGNTLKIIDGDDEISYTKSRDDILRNKGPLEGIWEAPYRNPDNPDEIWQYAWIFSGELMIATMKSEFYTDYMAAEFSYSDLDNTLTAEGDTISCKVSGDLMTLTDGPATMQLTRKR